MLVKVGNTMKINFKKLLLSLLLIFLNLGLIYNLININVIGPNNYYDNEYNEAIETVSNKSKSKDVEEFIFSYKTYTAKTDDGYSVYDEDYNLVGKVKNKDLDFDGVKAVVAPLFDEEYEVSITYGYDSLVYVASNENKFVLLDQKDLDIIYLYEGVW